MHKIFFLFLLVYSSYTKAQTHSLEKIWETDTIIAIPESVLPDLKNNILYVSLINGGAWAKNGNGGIGKLSMDGKNYDSTWITGLNAPKGMGIYKNNLYVADLSDVVLIDIATATIIYKYVFDGSSRLNDITVDSNGIVYASASGKGRIWRIENNNSTLFLEDLKGLNGLKAIGSDLYIGAGKEFLKSDLNKKLTKIADLPQAIDGIEPVGNGDFILTAWSGYIFYVSAGGLVETLLETHGDKINTADIGFDPVKKVLYVPTFYGKKIIAYQLK